MNTPLWRPSPERAEAANITAFRHAAETDWGVTLADHDALYQWSIDNIEQFWTSVWRFGGIIASRDWDDVLVDGHKMPGAQWFPGARLNFAENLLRRRDDGDALVFRAETGATRRLSFAELHDQVGRLARALRAEGVVTGDRVGGFMPNMPETIIAMLATASIGAVWSSCSPDFGVQGVMDRFGQIEPKVLFTADGYFYNGKTVDSLERVAGIAARSPSIGRVVVVSFAAENPDISGLDNAVHFADYLGDQPAGDIDFEQLPFDHPLFIMYSSGTTGMPKCIVHGAGGTLIKHHCEHRLHTDVGEADRLFYFTTCGWMMWNWLVSGLAIGATVMLYDGSPFYPDGETLWRYAADEGITIFGTSAKYIAALEKAGVRPGDGHDLSQLRAVLSTGSPLAPEGFDYVYDAIKTDLCLSSISGGTDIMGCFALGNPAGPVWRGELQSRALGLKVEVYDDHGQPLVGEQGELVCSRPFPSMPVSFWDDDDGAKYHAAYFDRFPNIWNHGDFVELTERGGMIIHGRSDAVLNPGGVRIGTSEIYRQVEKIDQVIEGICVGQQWDSDVRVVLFVVLRPGVTLDETLSDRIKAEVRANTTPRHVPAKIIQVAEIPRTISGKIVELAVRNVIHGRPVRNKDALANPDALKLYENLEDLQS
jgi:acetoacetyl-CoA synthetase